MNPEPRVNDGCRILAHLTGADRMMNGAAMLLHEMLNFIAGLYVRSRRELAKADFLQRGRREDAAASASESSDRSESESESERDALGFAKSASSGLFLERPLSGDRLEEPRSSERSELSSELSEERSAAATSVSFGSKDARFAGYDSSKGFGSATRSAAATVSTSATAFGASNGGLAKSA